MTRALSRQESKELTKKRLIDGALRIVRTEGVTAATTGRIAREAGIKQPSFYGHFADRDACLAAAAQKVGDRVVSMLRDRRLAIDPGRDLAGSVERTMATVIDAFLAEPELTRMFLRYRGDDVSPLGRTFRQTIWQVHRDLQKEMQLWRVGGSPAEAEVHAELLISGALGLIEGLLDGRVSDREAAVDGMTSVISAALAAAFERKD